MTAQVGGTRSFANAQQVALLPATTLTGVVASTNGPSIGGFGWATTAIFELNVTAVAADAGDTLDVKVQTTIDGTNWIDVIHFTQITGAGAAVIRAAKVVNALAQAEFTGALGANALRHILGDQWRVNYVVAQDDAAAFTFSVTANFQ